MVHNSGFEIVRRQRHHEHLADRDLLGDTGALVGSVVANLGGAVGGVLGIPPASSGGGGGGGGGGSTGGSPGSGGGTPSGGGSTGGGSPAGSGTGGAAGTSGGGTTGVGAGEGAPASGSSNGQVNNAANPSPTAAGAGAAAASAMATPAAGSGSSAPAAVFTTQLITASDGTVATSVIPIGPAPSLDPFGNIAYVGGAGDNANSGVPSINVPPGGYGPNGSNGGDSGSSNNNRIIIPVAVVAGVLALGLLIALILQKQRNSMERELRKPRMMSDKANLVAATSGGLGFTAAGIFRRNRRGSDYQKSSNGHGETGDHKSWLAGRPISEAIQSGDLVYDDTSSINTSAMGHRQTEMSNNEIMAASGGLSRPQSVFNSSQQSHQMGQALSSNVHNTGPMDYDSSQGDHRQSVITGEGGYATASEDGGPAHGSFFDHGRPRNDVADEASNQSHYDGSAPYGYSNPAVKGLDAAAVQGATGGQMLSPYSNVQRSNDARYSVANTEVSTGQAYDGADLSEDPFNMVVEDEARPNPHYDGNRVMKHSNLNSSRWSG